MAKTLQFRRDTTANLASVTGSPGEIFIDTTKKTVVVMDGSTSGGFPLELQGAGTGATGIQGASGSIGVNGATGSNGTNGATGSIGVNGATGYAGAPGASGSQGIQGSSGAAGTNGSNGSNGSNGATGVPGSNGTDGATGTQGVQGASGSTGLTGATGSQGITGASGATGAKGDQGNFGGAAFDYLYDSSFVNDSDPGTGKFKFNNTALNSATFLYINETDYLSTAATSFLETIDDSTSSIKGHFSMAKKTDDTKYTLFAITGAHTKTGSYYKVPVSYLSGDTTHVDEEENILTFARTGDKGDTGLTGATGSQGVQGASGVGATGAAGSNGTNGATGITGASGSQGIQGSSGAAGTNGTNGSNGTNGATGTAGSNGAAGATGSAGINGATGTAGSNGTNGATGSAGVNGSTGAGLTGATGTAGSNGSNGATGTAGNTGATGAAGPSSGYLNGPISGFSLLIGATSAGVNTGATGNGWFGNALFVGPQGATGIAFGATGEIRATAEITAYYSSDERLKENILTIDNALGKLRKLKGVMFDWKDDVVAGRGGEDGYFVRKHDTGVIAQEVEAVLPEVVAERADGFKAVRYEKLAGLIIQAINELADQVDALKK